MKPAPRTTPAPPAIISMTAWFSPADLPVMSFPRAFPTDARTLL
jgi:hypothetical protein